ncbi:MAG TPA: polysaccharide deacetylase family protein [Ferruginibacter sp.]|nr:polysaccharide deacetylase family protein [Ferruginibacter sp.]
MFYLIRTPGWVKKVYKSRVWDITTSGQELFLSFDDGPHPEHTAFVLDELKKYNAKATFFCIGKNVLSYPEIYKRIIEEGHTVGNHTYDHLNGSKTTDARYMENIMQAKQYIDSHLFRPPYGKISGFLVKQLLSPVYGLKTIMWTVLSGDFDIKISKEQCLQNVILNSNTGSIVVFHDSEKASERMKYALPKVLEYFAAKGFLFKAISA